MRGHASPLKLTYDDFLLFPDDGKRHELIDGEHYVTPSPNTQHQRVSMAIAYLLTSWLEQHPLGEVFHAPYDVVLSEFDVVEPDLVYLSHGRARTVLTDAHARGAPELVIEILSKTTRRRDETLKRRLYERVGVDEYWIVDPAQELVRVFRRLEDRLVEGQPRAKSRNETLSTPLLPGLELSLVRVFKT
ncbi:MAG TPA: Uma2 family endonuclease [Vicinamibacterales bacterium]|jgi:Uma2 family endonuclease|nr:Uma2 family endonuclease [Vicinamibacterales bacterium]